MTPVSVSCSAIPSSSLSVDVAQPHLHLPPALLWHTPFVHCDQGKHQCYGHSIAWRIDCDIMIPCFTCTLQLKTGVQFILLLWSSEETQHRGTTSFAGDRQTGHVRNKRKKMNIRLTQGNHVMTE